MAEKLSQAATAGQLELITVRSTKPHVRRQNQRFREHNPGIIPVNVLFASAKSQRLRDAYFHTTENWTIGKTVDRRQRELRDMHGYVEARSSAITLDDFPFDTKETYETDVYLSRANKVNRLVRSTFMPFGPYGTIDLFTSPKAEEFFEAIHEHGSMSQADRRYFKVGGDGASPLRGELHTFVRQIAKQLMHSSEGSTSFVLL